MSRALISLFTTVAVSGALSFVAMACGGGGETTPIGTGGHGGGSLTTTTTGNNTTSGDPTTTTGDPTTSGSTSGSGTMCTEAWLCSPWDTGGAGDMATRTCTDVNGCGSTTMKPVETATLPALDLNYFKCNVEPILDRKCSMLGCHGKEKGRQLRVYSRARLRIPGGTITSVDPSCPGNASADACAGSTTCSCKAPHSPTEWQRNYDSARGFKLDPQGKPIPMGMADASDLLAQPIVGGKAHTGVHLFRPGDPEEKTLKAWLDGATLASCNPGSN